MMEFIEDIGLIFYNGDSRVMLFFYKLFTGKCHWRYDRRYHNFKDFKVNEKMGTKTIKCKVCNMIGEGFLINPIVIPPMSTVKLSVGFVIPEESI